VVEMPWINLLVAGCIGLFHRPHGNALDEVLLREEK
jgi:hypothetical protein